MRDVTRIVDLTCHGWEQNNASAGYKWAQTFQSPELVIRRTRCVLNQCFIQEKYTDGGVKFPAKFLF